jgi:hypothetical protein
MGFLSGIMVRQGTWWLNSKSDPRWNSDGRSQVGGLEIPEECQKKIDELKQTLGDPPKDLEWGYMKD